MLYVDFFSYISGEFQVFRSVGARFNGSNLLKKSDCCLSFTEIWTISATWNKYNMLTLFGLLYPYGNNISEKVWAIVYYQVAGSPEPQ